MMTMTTTTTRCLSRARARRGWVSTPTSTGYPVVVSRAGERVDDEDEDRIESNRIESNRARRSDDRRRDARRSSPRSRDDGRSDDRTNGRMDGETTRALFFFEAPVEVVSGALLPRARRMGTVSWGYEETFRARAVLDIRNRRVSWRASAGGSPGARARRWLV